MSSDIYIGSGSLRFHNDWEGFAITFVSAYVATFVLSKAFRQPKWRLHMGNLFAVTHGDVGAGGGLVLEGLDGLGGFHGERRVNDWTASA